MTVKTPLPPSRRHLSDSQRALLTNRLERALKVSAQAEPASSIPRRNASDDLPLSFAQQQLWFLEQLEPGTAAYNICHGVRMRGPLDVSLLEKALNEVVRRHEILRTNFAATGGRPLQIIAPHRVLTLNVVDLVGWVNGAAELELQRAVQDEIRRPFDLTKDVLVRTLLVRQSPDEHTLVVTMHHIVSDGWSMGVLFGEMVSTYSALREGRSAQQPELPLQFGDFVVWQRDDLQGAALEKTLAYWREQLAGTPSVLELPYDHLPSAVSMSQGAVHSVLLTPALMQAVKTLSQREGATLFMTLLTAFQVLLCRWTNQEEFLVGSVVAGRCKVELEKLIGLFAGTLVVRSDLRGQPTFRALLERVKQTTLSALAHQDLPFDQLVKEVQPNRASGRNPLFQVLFVLQNAPMSPPDLPDLKFESLELHTGTAKFDLTLAAMETPEGLQVAFEYSTALFQPATIERLLVRFQTLLEAVVADPDQVVTALPLLSDAERQQMLVDWNDTAMPYARDACIHELFEEQVRRTPDAIAIVGERDRMTYAELNRRADRLAERLRAAGVEADTKVGIFLERSPSLLVAIFGVLKAGGGYVPLDPAYPRERLEFIADDTKMPVLIAQRRLAADLPAGSMDVIWLDDETDPPRESGVSRSSAVERARPSATSLAYIIYTSGSTGRPKGVCIVHRCVTALVAWAQQLYTPEELSGVLFSTSASFDISIFEIFCPLLLGGKIILAENILQAGAHPAADEITFLSGVPSAMSEVVRLGLVPKHATTVALAGELFPSPLVEALYALPQIKRVFELYGPTETTVYSTGAVRERGSAPSLGRPFPNERCYVLDAALQPVPIGVAGELFIAGDKLARGYLNRPELTAEKFLNLPWRPDERVYRTGDRARWLADGTLEFAGRLDHQVKIRGFRVELGEVQNVLAAQPAVAESVVLARPDPSGNNRLLAYVVLRPGAAATSADLRAPLQQQLPEYMVPSAIVVLDRFPLTANGKLDRRALPEPEFKAAVEMIAPQTETEQLISEIWCDVLGLKQVGVHDNFLEIGGHSLLAAQVIARIHDALGIEFSMRQFFRTPTIAGMAAIIEAALIDEIRATTSADGSEEVAARKEQS